MSDVKMDGKKYCIQCGEQLRQESCFCPKCGKSVAEQTAVCAQSANSGMDTVHGGKAEKKRKRLIVAIAALAVLLGGLVVLLSLILPSRKERVIEIVNNYCYDRYYDGYADDAKMGLSLWEEVRQAIVASDDKVRMKSYVNEDIPNVIDVDDFEAAAKDLLCVEIAVEMNETEDYLAYFLFGCDAYKKKKEPVPLGVAMLDAEGNYSNYLGDPKDTVTVLYSWLLYLKSYYEILGNYDVQPPSHEGTYQDFAAHEALADLMNR